MAISTSVLSLQDTLPSGQCFRFSENAGTWTVKAGIGSSVRILSVRQENAETILSDPFWHNFFDMDTDYAVLRERFSRISPVMEAACAYAPGIRILNQDPWEALCSFVVSQNNNIKRIMGIVERLCSRYGEKNPDGIPGFPTPQALAGADDTVLEQVGLGYRVPYIKAVAGAVLDGSINFNFLKTAPVEDARKMLLKVNGIGPKVADCALLFGCHRMDCFPKDVWIKRVMERWFPNCTEEVFGDCAGVAQQYLFHYSRTSGIFKEN